MRRIVPLLLLVCCACSSGSATKSTGSGSVSGSDLKPAGAAGSPSGLAPGDAHEALMAQSLTAKTRSVEGKQHNTMGSDEKFVFTIEIPETLKDVASAEASVFFYSIQADEPRGPDIGVGVGQPETLDAGVAVLELAGYKIVSKESLGAGWVLAAIHEQLKKIHVEWSKGEKPFDLSCNGLVAGDYAMAHRDAFIAMLTRACKSLTVKEYSPPKRP